MLLDVSAFGTYLVTVVAREPVYSHISLFLKRVIVHIYSRENFAPRGVIIIRDTADAKRNS